MPVYEKATKETLKRVNWDLIPDHVQDRVLELLGDWIPQLTAKPYGDVEAMRQAREDLISPAWSRAIKEARRAATVDAPGSSQEAPSGAIPPEESPGGPVVVGDDLKASERSTRVCWHTRENFLTGTIWGYGTISHKDEKGFVWVVPDGATTMVKFTPDPESGRLYVAQNNRVLYYAQEGPQKGRSGAEGADQVVQDPQLRQGSRDVPSGAIVLSYHPVRVGSRVAWKKGDTWSYGFVERLQSDRSTITVESADVAVGVGLRIFQWIKGYGTDGIFYNRDLGTLYWDDRDPDEPGRGKE